MQQKVNLQLSPAEAADDSAIIGAIARETGMTREQVSGFYLLKRSIDARSRAVRINLTVQALIEEPFHQRKLMDFAFRDVHNSPLRCVIIGGGPAGMFAALRFLEAGIKPVILERGKEVRARRRDLAVLNKQGIINPESNYCFGEGGAGTYSDGKLYTRSSKRGNIERILNLFVHFGAPDNILYDAHPHIGTNKLPQIITDMRKRILDCGGEFHFEKKVTALDIHNGQLRSVGTADGERFNANAFILATGHSARDIFHLLYKKNIDIKAKGFALGVRAEHPQQIIDQIQYGKGQQTANELKLPPASYSLVHQADGRGVFSFCMCPGGIIAPAATADGELVVNGWSPSKRNNPYANSGLVVQVEPADVHTYFSSIQHKNYDRKSPLLMMDFQQEVENKAFSVGGGRFVAPAQRLVDFTENRISENLPKCSYQPGISTAPLQEVLPHFISKRLQLALRAFGKKMPARNANSGYFTNEAVLVATESRTSSPVRIPRDETRLHHPQVTNLFPCGEGAGYAGGIVSAAMDGERVSDAITVQLKK